jgi:hypothetical protein
VRRKEAQICRCCRDGTGVRAAHGQHARLEIRTSGGCLAPLDRAGVIACCRSRNGCLSRRSFGSLDVENRGSRLTRVDVALLQQLRALARRALARFGRLAALLGIVRAVESGIVELGEGEVRNVRWLMLRGMGAAEGGEGLVCCTRPDEMRRRTHLPSSALPTAREIKRSELPAAIPTSIRTPCVCAR